MARYYKTRLLSFAKACLIADSDIKAAVPPGRVYKREAPTGALTPYITLACLADLPVVQNGLSPTASHLQLAVRVYGLDAQEAQLEALMDRIEPALRLQARTVSGVVFECTGRVRPDLIDAAMRNDAGAGLIELPARFTVFAQEEPA